MSQPRELSSEERLLQAAEAVFQEIEDTLRSLPRLTVVNVARRAGVSRATANRYPAFLERLEELQTQVSLVTKADVKRAAAEARAGTDELRERLSVYANQIQALTLELEDARAEKKVIPLKGQSRP